MTAVTERSRAKSDRRWKLLAAAKRLMAERGYLAVRLEDIGSAAGVSGPAIYRHFPNKEAMLVELLVDVSTGLLAGAQAVLADAPDPAAAVAALVDFHLDFAIAEPDLIRIQDRDLANVPAGAQRQVRRAQRRYVELWADTLRGRDERLGDDDARVLAHAAFGLLNSTAHSLKPAGDPGRSRLVLRAMTLAGLTGLQPAGDERR